MDEADRMFDLGFIKDIRFLLRRMPERTTRQTLLFSATLSHRVLELAYEHMNEPEKLVVEAETVTAARVRQRMYLPADDEKIPLLLGLLSRSEGARTMVFVNTKAFVERVARALERAGYRVGVLSGDVPQKKRETLLKRFQAGQLELLVATDVAARGLHIDGVSHVYNYDLPFDAEDYVHRIGRTARLGAEGDAISFACERYAMSLPDIEAYIEQKIPVEPVTAELLTALPRPERAPLPPGEDDGEAESVSAIFREAREQKAADEARRGGGRSGSGGGGRSGSREGGRSGARDGAGSRGPRPPRRPRSEPVAGEAAVAPIADAPVAEAPRPVPAAAVGGEAPHDPNAPQGEKRPRKRRRRRHGRPVEGAEGAAQPSAGSGNGAAGPRAPRAKPEPSAAAPVAKAKPAPAAASAAGNDSFLTRLGRKIKSLVGG
jgi:ATP-dependent RNA helicase RhlB